MTPTNRYSGFEYTADQIRKFTFASDFFTILLKNSEIVQFTPKDMLSFKAWLEAHNIENIRNNPAQTPRKSMLF